MDQQFYQELQLELPTSDTATRFEWAKVIVRKQWDITLLFPFLLDEFKLASRCAWFLSDIGMHDANLLSEYLDFFFKKRKEIETFNFESAFIKYWTICGIPEIHEGEALDIAFGYLTNPKTKVHIKTLSASLVFELSKKYPDLKNELKIILEEEKERNSISFRHRANKLLKQLSSIE